MPDWFEKLVQEEKELHEKWRNLAIFKVSKKFSELDYLEQEYLIIQAEHMWNYLSILRKRIALEESKCMKNFVK